VALRPAAGFLRSSRHFTGCCPRLCERLISESLPALGWDAAGLLTPQTLSLLSDAERLRGESLSHLRVARTVPPGIERGPQHADLFLADVRDLVQL
jgi:hypothetical protein